MLLMFGYFNMADRQKFCIELISSRDIRVDFNSHLDIVAQNIKLVVTTILLIWNVTLMLSYQTGTNKLEWSLKH